MRLMPALRVPPVAIKSSTCSATHNSSCDSHPSHPPFHGKRFAPSHCCCLYCCSQTLTSTTFCPGCTAPVCISILSVEYSVMYDSEMVSPAGHRHNRSMHLSCSTYTMPLRACFVLAQLTAEPPHLPNCSPWHQATAKKPPPGSLPGLRRGTNAHPSAKARGAPKMRPRASNPAGRRCAGAVSKPQHDTPGVAL